MKRFTTISAALVLGTLMFNVTLARAGEKEMKGQHNSKSYKHDEHRRDFWKDFCYDYCCYGCDYCDFYCSCCDQCGYDRCGEYGYCFDHCFDHCNHDGSNHDGWGTTTTKYPPRIGNNPPGVPPHEGPSGPKQIPVWERGGKGIVTVDGNLFPKTPKPIIHPISEKSGSGIFTVLGQQNKQGSANSNSGGRPPKK